MVNLVVMDPEPIKDETFHAQFSTENLLNRIFTSLLEEIFLSSFPHIHSSKIPQREVVNFSPRQGKIKKVPIIIHKESVSYILRFVLLVLSLA